jgi:DNA-binding NarL/FixJ family response regulator
MEVLIVDERQSIHDMLGQIARQAIPNATVLSALDLAEAHALARNTRDLKVVMLSLEIAGYTGIEALCHFRAAHPNVPILIVLASKDRELILKARQAGAKGYVPRAASQQVITGALHLVAAGETYFPPLPVEESCVCKPTKPR